MEIREQYKNIKEYYKVSNLNLENAKFIFVLESPHIDEIKHGTPVAGYSGRQLTQRLFEGEYTEPLGLLVKNKKDADNRLKSIGIMNVCQIPMQQTAYNDLSLYTYRDIIENIEMVRNKKKLSDTQYFLKNLIINDFKKELEIIYKKTEETYIIPCGRIAESYLRYVPEIQNYKNLKVHNNTPHPSFGHWSKKRGNKEVEMLIEKFNIYCKV